MTNKKQSDKPPAVFSIFTPSVNMFEGTGRFFYSIKHVYARILLQLSNDIFYI